MTWQHALGVSHSRLDTYSTGSTSVGRDAFASALFSASMCSNGYAGLLERNPDWIIARLTAPKCEDLAWLHAERLDVPSGVDNYQTVYRH